MNNRCVSCYELRDIRRLEKTPVSLLYWRWLETNSEAIRVGMPFRNRSKNYSCFAALPFISCKRKEVAAVCTKCRNGRASFWNMVCWCYFSYVPDALLIQEIFSFMNPAELARMALVCRRWSFLTSDRHLWRKIELTNLPKDISEESLVSLIVKHSSSVEILKLCDFPLSESSLKTLSCNLRRLKEIHLCGSVKTNDSIMDLIVERNRDIQGLYIGGCRNLSSASLETIAEKLPYLKRLSIQGCQFVSFDHLSNVSSNLIELNISSCFAITENPSWSKDLVRFTSLTKLNLHALDISDSDVFFISKSCPKLSSLYLSSANPFRGSKITDVALKYLSELRQLSDLNILGSKKITDQGIDYLSTGCPYIQKLCLGGCSNITDLSLSFISRRLLKMTHLSLFQCERLTDWGIEELAKSSTPLSYLDLTGCQELTRRSVYLLVSGFSWLEYVNLSMIRNLEFSDVQELQARVGLHVAFY